MPWIINAFDESLISKRERKCGRRVVRDKLLKMRNTWCPEDDAKVTQVERKQGSVRFSWLLLSSRSLCRLFPLLGYVVKSVIISPLWILDAYYTTLLPKLRSLVILITIVCPKDLASIPLCLFRWNHFYCFEEKKKTDSLFCCDAQEHKILLIMNRPTSAYSRALAPLRLITTFFAEYLLCSTITEKSSHIKSSQTGSVP